MVHFLQTRNFNYSLLAQNVAALLSLLMIRRPATLLPCLSQDQLSVALANMYDVFVNKLSTSLHLHSVRFSVLAYMNIVPTLWHMTTNHCAQIQQWDLQDDVACLCARLISLIGRGFVCERGRCTCFLADEPMDYSPIHALFLYVCPVKEFFVDPQ